MRFSIRFALCVSAVLLGAALGGCAPGQGQSDEEKEPHFVLGQSRVNAMDYPGAIEAFEESLEANPQSAAAHFELGWLYEEKASDPAAAIYHYERYLKLNPNAGNVALIAQHIDACKQQLAADVLGLPSTSAAQQQLEKLAGQNRVLQQQVDQLQDTVKQWNAYYASQLAARSNSPPQNDYVAQPSPSPLPDDISVAPATTPDSTQSKPAPPKSTRPHTHTVVTGETAVGIARKFGVKLSALEAVNPGMNPARIRVGQVLNLPSPGKFE
jgi:LysM repeat protein